MSALKGEHDKAIRRREVLKGKKGKENFNRRNRNTEINIIASNG